jgi:hypothetical protein
VGSTMTPCGSREQRRRWSSPVGKKLEPWGGARFLYPREAGEADRLVGLSAIVTFSICLNTFEIDS